MSQTRAIRMTRAVLAVLLTASTVSAAQSKTPAEIQAFFKAYDEAYNAKDLAKLATMYHLDVTVFEGGGIDRGWLHYRNDHLGPELKSFQDLKWAHSNLVVHPLGSTSAFVTADYRIVFSVGGRATDSSGIATDILIKERGAWRILHSHTAARRR